MSATSSDAASPAPPTSPSSPPPAPVASERHVDINEYDVDGNTLLDAVAIERAVTPFEGPQRPVSDTERARAALEHLYAERGYQAVVVQLPPQNVQGGVVHIKVIEATIGKVTIAGQRYADEDEVSSALPSAKPGQVPNFKALNNDLVALNGRSADLQVTPQLKPGSAPDTIDVDLTVNDALPVHGSIELNNNYSQDTDPLRLQGNVAYDDLWGMGHTISGYFDIAPHSPADAQVYLLSYTAPLPGSDIRLSLTGLRSDSNVATVGATDVIGKGYSATLGASAPLPTLGNYAQSLQGSIAFKDFTDVVSVTGQSDNAPITYYPFAVTYNGTWRGQSDLAQVSGAINVAFRGLGSGQPNFDAKRYRALPDFVYFRGSVSYQHDFALGPQVYLETDGQLSNEPLISNEQFSAGGNGSVRGYLQSEALGDNGVHSSIELRSPELAPWMDKSGKLVDEFRVFGFGDAAKAWLLSPLPEQQDAFSLLGFGLGLRGKALSYLNFEGDWGHALRDSVATKDGQDRFYFRLFTQF